MWLSRQLYRCDSFWPSKHIFNNKSLFMRKFSSKRPTVPELIEGVLNGNRMTLSRAITLVESTNKSHRKEAEILLDQVLALRSNNNTSFRMGIAGPPGAGKSTFIESLGIHLTEKGHRVAVLAIDPSSSISKGSILGDKTRMPFLSANDNAFVRPSPTRGALGGVAQHTNDIVLLCEAAGYDIVLVESVGLGQSEIVIDETVDLLALLVPPGGGDELQGSKKGIMEVSDLIIVNKADGDLLNTARHTAAEYNRATQLIRRKNVHWKPTVKLCSALERSGIDKVWATVTKFQDVMTKENQIRKKRDKQSTQWMWNQLQMELTDMVRHDDQLNALAKDLRHRLVDGTICPRSAARTLLGAFLSSNHQMIDADKPRV